VTVPVGVLETAPTPGVAVGSNRGWFSKAGAAAEGSVLAGGLTRALEAPRKAALVLLSSARCNARCRACCRFVLMTALVGKAGKAGGETVVWAHRPDVVRSKVSSNVFTVVWQLSLPL
jgi:hypothetical protein